MNRLWRWTKALPAILATPFLVLLAALAVALADLSWLAFGRRKRRAGADTMPDTNAASGGITTFAIKNALVARTASSPPVINIVCFEKAPINSMVTR